MLKLNRKIFAPFRFGFFFVLLLVLETRTNAATSILQQIEKEVNQLVELAKPSVVTISSKVSYSYTVSSESFSIPFFEKKGVKRSLSFRNVGSGIIFDTEGHIITKSNVVQYADIIEVTMFNCKRYTASLIGYDPETGLAVIKIDEQKLIPVKFGNSSEVKEGDWITVIGNSLGVLPSVSLGLINGIRTEDELIQLSAFINPGNSGSPIYNTKGEVIGIVAATLNAENQMLRTLFSSQPTVGGIAYPSNRIKKIVQEIIRNKDNKRGWLGVTADDDRLTPSGRVCITSVVANSPAAKAGLKPSDLILEINNIKLKNAIELIKLIENSKPDSIIQLKIIRDHKLIPAEVTIGERPEKQSYFSPIYALPLNEIYPQQPKSFTTNETAIRNTLQQRVEYLETELNRLKVLLKQQ